MALASDELAKSNAAILDHIDKLRRQHAALLNAVVDGTIPAGFGLKSARLIRDTLLHSQVLNRLAQISGAEKNPHTAFLADAMKILHMD